MTLLTDYGLADEYVSVCKAVAGAIAPAASILDITHSIRPFAVREAGNVLARAVPFMPSSVHVAVVDPGVGSGRRPVVVATPEGSLLVGPDNGLLIAACEALGGVTHAHEISNRSLMLPAVSHTFHGRDIFAPVAAHLFNGISPEEVGPPVAPETLVRLPETALRVHGDHLHTELVHIDAFGNLQLGVRATERPPGEVLRVDVDGIWVDAPFAGSFSSVAPGEWVLTEDSSGWLSLSINSGNAALTLRAETGDQVVVGPPGFACEEATE